MSGTYLPTSPYFRLEVLADGAWLAIAKPGSGAFGNAGIVDLGGATLVFDTMFTPAAARELKSAAEALTGRAPRYVVNSHFHVDHVNGNASFPEAVVIATAKTAPLIAEHSGELLTIMRERGMELAAQAKAETTAIADPAIRHDREVEDADYAALICQAHETEIRLPDVLFDSRLTITGATRTAELITWGGGHTPSDAVLSLPSARILFTGDLIFYRHHPSINYGDAREWLRILDEMEKLEIMTLTPGHGEVATHAAIAEQRKYLETTLSLAQEAVMAGKSADEAAMTPIPEQYHDYGFAGGFAHLMRALHTYQTSRAGAPAHGERTAES